MTWLTAAATAFLCSASLHASTELQQPGTAELSLPITGGEYSNFDSPLVSVLLGFDESGFSLRRVIRPSVDRHTLAMSNAVRDGVTSTNRDANTEQNQIRLIPRRVLAAATGARISWFDANGQILSIEPVSDPRLIRAPHSAVIGRNQSPVGHGDPVLVTQGVMLVKGPVGAASLELSLPELSVTPQSTEARSGTLGQAQNWHFDLF